MKTSASYDPVKSMPAPVSIEIRRQIVERHEKGESLKSISRELNLPYVTVKSIWRHWRVHQKLEPNYEQAKLRGTRRYGHLYARAIAMKQAHPKWGAGLILLELQPEFPEASLPSERTLQRWFREEGVGNPPKTQQRSQTSVARGRFVHQVWAVDAKERMRLKDESGASWLLVTDEASGAVLGADAFPLWRMDES